MKHNRYKSRLLNGILISACTAVVVGCNNDSSSSDTDSPNPTPPPVTGYVEDQGFHLTPLLALFSGEANDNPVFDTPDGALAPVVTSDSAVKDASTRSVVQFTSVDASGLVAGFDLGTLDVVSLDQEASFEFDLRLAGQLNGIAVAQSVDWRVEILGVTASDSPQSFTFDVSKTVTEDWQHFVFAYENILDSGLSRLDSVRIYPNAANLVYNIDNIAIYDEYKDSEGPILVLNGDADLKHLNYPDSVDVFEDPGYTVTDNQDDPSEITVTEAYGILGAVDGDTNGVYTITYETKDTTGNYGKPVTRTVTVEAAVQEEVDTTPPEITLNGPASVRIPLGEAYQEQGATALDDVDGVIEDITIDASAVDVYTLGEYKIIYQATDLAGNTATAERTVIVYQPAEGGNLVVNGDFTGELSGTWELQEGEGTTTIVDEQLVISDYIPGQSWQPRLVQGDIKLEPGQGYQLQFDAKAGEARNIVLQVGELLTTDPWYMPFHDDTTVQLATEMQTHTINFTASDNAANSGHLIFAIGGGAATPITLDNITLAPLTAEMIGPQLTLVGGSVRVQQGQPYIEPGYSAIDNVDGDLSASVVVTGDDFDTSVLGNYTITYSVEDSDGNTTTVQRSVQVVSAENIDNLITNGDFSSGLDEWLLFGGNDAQIVDGAVNYTTGVLKQERFAEGMVQGGELYKVTFRFKGSFTTGGVFKVGLHSEMPEGIGAVSHWQEYWTISSDWQQMVIDWPVAEGAESISIELLIAGPAGQDVYLDDVEIKLAD